MMMQDKNNRSLNYTIIDRCQDNICIDNDEYYRQILHLNEYFICEQDIKIILTNRFRLILFIILILSSQSNALPILQTQNNYNQLGSLSYIQQPSPSLPAPINYSRLPQQPPQLNPYKVYRRFPNPVQPIPSYSNGAVVQIYDQTNFNNQQQSSMIAQNPNEQQLSLQIRRERQRRAMVDRMILLFDDDGNGQLTKDELYSMALRSNMFPKFHYYLKQTPI